MQEGTMKRVLIAAMGLSLLLVGAQPGLSVELLVNSTTVDSQSEPAIASDSSGFVVVWRSYGQDGDDYGIVGQRYASTGSPMGTEFQINQYTTGSQEDSAVARAANGDFVVVWDSEDGQDGDSDGIFGQRFSSSGAAIGAEFLVPNTTTGSQTGPHIAADSDGDFVVVWQTFGQDGDGSGVFGRRFASSGSAIGSEFQVNTTTAGNQDYPAVAGDAGGTSVVVWSDDGGSIFGKRYNSSGAALGTEFQVNTYTTDPSTHPAVSMQSNGDFVVTWQSYDGFGDGIHGQRFDSSGAQLGTEFQVNTVTVNTQMYPVVAVQDDSAFVVVWQGDDVYGYGIRGQRYASNGARVGPEFPVNTYTSGHQTHPVVTARGDGRFVIAWQSPGQDGDGFGILASVPGPLALGYEFQANTYATSCQTDSAVSGDADGDFVVVWASAGQDGDQGGIFGQRYASDGAPVGTEFGVNTYTTNSQTVPSVASAADGNFVVVWTNYAPVDGDSAGVFGQRYASNGTTLGSEFQVNSYTTGMQYLPSVAAKDNGDFMVVWTGQDQAGFGIVGQRFASSGALLGSEFQSNTYTTDVQNWPVVAVDGDGDFVVAWQSYTQDGSDYGVFAQRYDSSGAAAGTEFRVNSHTTGDQEYPVVGAAADGTFVVVWESGLQDGDDLGVFGQRYASDGSALGTEFQVNTTTADDQAYSAVAMKSNGDFTVTWHSLNQDGSDRGIFGQRFDRDGAPVGDEFLINTVTANDQRYPAAAVIGENVVTVWTSDDHDGDACGIFGQLLELPGRCPATPVSCSGGFAKGMFLVKESIPGKEKILAKMLGGPEILQPAFGDPLDPGGTVYNLCVYDDTPALVAELHVDRAGAASCNGGECWSALGGDPPNGKGYSYKDKDATVQGIAKILLKGGAGSAGKSKILVKGKGSNLPLPIAAALTSATAVTVQLHAEGTGCFGITLSDIKTQQGDAFTAK
jgi:hypothetical protein